MTANTATDGDKTPGGLVGAIKYWGPPVLLGLVIGGAFVGLWRAKLFQSDVARLAADWEWGKGEENGNIEDEIRGLGRGAAEDLYSAFMDASCDEPDFKVWLGEILTGEPFHDTSSLVDAIRDGDECDRRAASVVLAFALGERADHDLVLPGIVEWLEDLDEPYHELPVQSAASLVPLYGQWHDRVKAALLALAEKPRPANADPTNDFTDDDRAAAMDALGAFLPDEDVAAFLIRAIQDESQGAEARIYAVRALATNEMFDDVAAWYAAGRSADPQIRQAVAANLTRTAMEEYDELLAEMHVDPDWMVRQDSIDAQYHRRRPTVLPVIDVLLEDSAEWVRFEAAQACSMFKRSEGAAARTGMLLRLYEESDVATDVEGAVLALHSILDGPPPGFEESHIHRHMVEVDEGAVKAFIDDPEGRTAAAAELRKQLGDDAKWTREDRIATLEKLQKHADEENRKRADAELALLGGE